MYILSKWVQDGTSAVADYHDAPFASHWSGISVQLTLKGQLENILVLICWLGLYCEIKFEVVCCKMMVSRRKKNFKHKG